LGWTDTMQQCVVASRGLVMKKTGSIPLDSGRPYKKDKSLNKTWGGGGGDGERGVSWEICSIRSGDVRIMLLSVLWRSKAATTGGTRKLSS